MGFLEKEQTSCVQNLKIFSELKSKLQLSQRRKKGNVNVVQIDPALPICLVKAPMDNPALSVGTDVDNDDRATKITRHPS